MDKDFNEGVADLDVLSFRYDQLVEKELRENATAAHHRQMMGGGEYSNGVSTPTTRGQWVRTNDMRPAAVTREQRFADHEIVREHSQRSSNREDDRSAWQLRSDGRLDVHYVRVGPCADDLGL